MPICPFQSYANQKAECTPDCAIWRPTEGAAGQCGMLGVSDRLSEGFNELASLIREIKVKI